MPAINDKIVMVLDDDPGVAKYCQTVMERSGYEVITLLDARQAVGVLQQARVDLLLVDIRMPKLDGFQVMELARQHQPDLAIVIMTGFGTMETATKALRMGANGLILKPFSSSQELVEGVQRAIEDREHKKEIARLQALKPLLPITRRLISENHYDKLVDLILTAICELLVCEDAGFYAQEVNTLGTAVLKLVAGVGNALPDEESRFDGGPVARADAWGSPILVNPDAPDNPELRETIISLGFASVMCAPSLRGAQGNIVLMAGREGGRPPFTHADLEMFSIFANQAAVALENARLYANLRATLAQVRAQQQQLIQTEKMAAIGRLTASIAHEVNNPLQAVRNCLHLVGRADLAEEKREHYLELAQDELQRLMDTVQQMLDFYRPSALQREPVNLNALIDTVYSLLEKQLAQQNIRVEMHQQADLPQVVIVRNQIQQVFFNIILNAMEAMPEGGRMVITSHRNGHSVDTLFEDTGPGVSAERRREIFEPFASSKPRGTGLGLSVSYSILDAHGGRLELVDQDAERKTAGACFRISIPVVEAI